MKKTISIIISIAMCAMLASCGGVKNEVSDKKTADARRYNEP